MIRVTVTKDGEPFLEIALQKDDLIIGRGHEADVQLTSEAVSRRHARLQRVEGVWQVADLGAANGVYVSSDGQKEPERVVIRPLAAGDRIHIETFTIALEPTNDDASDAADGDGDPREADLDSLPRDGFDESSLETNRTQFISMVDVLAARQGPAREPTVTGPIMRFVSEESGPTLPHGPIAKPAPNADAALAEAVTLPPTSGAVNAAPRAVNAWVARMTSISGHERNFTLTAEKVHVGSGESCQVRLPTGPSVLVELERAGSEVAFRRVPLWPFPRVIVGGRAEKRGSLADGESFLVGEYEVTLHLRRDP